MTKTNTEVVLSLLTTTAHLMANRPHAFGEEMKEELLKALQAKDTQAEEMMGEVMEIECTWEEDEHDVIMKEVETIAQKYGINSDKK